MIAVSAKPSSSVTVPKVPSSSLQRTQHVRRPEGAEDDAGPQVQGEEDEEHYDRIKAFLRSLLLDVDNAVDLMRCNFDQQEEVMNTFKPKEGSRNMNVDFHIFLWRVRDRQEEEMPEASPVPERRRDGNSPSNASRPTKSARTSEADHGLTGMQLSDDATEQLDMLDDFVQTWGLDDTAIERLRSQSAEVQQDLMANFAPSPGLSNLSAAFMAFMKTRSSRAEVESPQTPPDHERSFSEERPEHQLDEQLEDFKLKWALADNVIEKLRELPQEVIDKVVADFHPPAECTDHSSKCVGFMKSRAEAFGVKMRLQKDSCGMREGDWICAACGDHNFARNTECRKCGAPKPDDVLHDFQTKWGLADNVIQRLQELPQEVIDRIVADFKPLPDCTDNNAKCMGFMKSRAPGHFDTRGGDLKRPQTESRSSDFAQKWESERPDQLRDFQMKWGLADNVIQKLQELPQEVIDSVVAEFKPPADCTDHSAKCVGFMKSRTGMVAYNPRGDETDWTRSDDVKRSQREYRSVDDFAKDWELDRHAAKKLSELPWDVQQDVMSNFSPKPGLSNISSFFMAYMKKKVPYHEPEPDLIDAFGQQWGLSEDCLQKLRDAPEEVQKKCMDIFNPRDQGGDVSGRFMTFLTLQIDRAASAGNNAWKHGSSWQYRHDPDKAAEAAPNTNRVHSRDELESFAFKWGLDDAAMERLRALPWEDQKHAMASFAPREGGGVNAKFVAFLRSRKPRSDGHAERPRSDGYAERPRSEGYADRSRDDGYAERPRSDGYAERPRNIKSDGYVERSRSHGWQSSGYDKQDPGWRSDGYDKQDSAPWKRARR